MKRAKSFLLKYKIGATICVLSLLYILCGVVGHNIKVEAVAGIALIIGWVIFMSAINESDDNLLKRKRNKKKAK